MLKIKTTCNNGLKKYVLLVVSEIVEGMSNGLSRKGDNEIRMVKNKALKEVTLRNPCQHDIGIGGVQPKTDVHIR